MQRWTRPERNGLGLMTELIAGFRKRGGEIVPETEITGLSLESGCVTGLQGRNTRTGEGAAVRTRPSSCRTWRLQLEPRDGARGTIPLQESTRCWNSIGSFSTGI